MKSKYFKQDKNYLLKTVQEELREELLLHVVRELKLAYGRLYNPLGLLDQVTVKLNAYELTDSASLEVFYAEVCAIYRFEIGTNQLEFLFDGRTHHERYTADWRAAFYDYVQQLFVFQKVIKAFLSLILFSTDSRSAKLPQLRLHHYLQAQFHIGYDRSEGMVRRVS